EFAIQQALEANRRIAYTTPLKALSNQKFGDFTRAYGEDKVGILTGDVKVNPHAPVLVMTTEILRNALYGSGLPGLGYIVPAECRRGRARVAGVERHGPNDRTRWYTRRVVDPATLIEALEQRRWLPAIYFIFSRAGCERAMEDVLTEGKPLITREQRREVDESIAQALADQPALGESSLSQSVFRGLRIGVALHHAG